MAKTDLFAVKVYPENVSKNRLAAGEDVACVQTITKL